MNDNLTVFFVLVLLHLLADYGLQGPLAVRKKGLNRFMWAHGLIAGAAFFGPLYNYPAGKTLGATVLLVLIHVLIDALKVEFNRIMKLEPSKYSYWLAHGVDQALHVATIFFLFRWVIG